MIKHITTLILFLFLCGMCPIGQNEVTRIIDGDTVEIDDKENIRILGLDTPEKTKGERLRKQAKRMGITEEEALHLGLVAKAKARKVLLNKCVTLESGRTDKGRFGRPLRYIRVDELDYSEFMLKEGLAMSYCGDKKDERYEFYNNLSKFKCE